MDEKRLAFQNKMGYNTTHDAPVAQLDRASDYGSEGCKFESCRARHLIPILWVGFFMPVISNDSCSFTFRNYNAPISVVFLCSSHAF